MSNVLTKGGKMLWKSEPTAELTVMKGKLLFVNYVLVRAHRRTEYRQGTREMVRTKFWKPPGRLAHKAQNRRDGLDMAAAEIVPIITKFFSQVRISIPQSRRRRYRIIVEICKVDGRYLRRTKIKWLMILVAKGQLISWAYFKVFIWTKNRTKIFLLFCPSL